jgi:hypothetical protein
MTSKFAIRISADGNSVEYEPKVKAAAAKVKVEKPQRPITYVQRGGDNFVLASEVEELIEGERLYWKRPDNLFIPFSKVKSG